MATGHNLDQLAGIMLRSFRGAQQAANLSGQMLNTYGTIVDVEDPDEAGRVRITLDEVNPEFLQGKDFDQAGEATETDWIYPIVPMKGKQPKALVGKRVPIVPRSGDPNRLNFGDPVFDPDEYEKAEQPKNSAMTRLPCYPAGELPPATEENVGCMIVELAGPNENDWLMVCLKRYGDYKWVRHIDRLHYHDGQLPDNDPGDASSNDTQNRTWDATTETTNNEKEGTD